MKIINALCVDIIRNHKEIMKFKIVSKLESIEVIAKGKSIKNLKRLNKIYGFGKWRKLKAYTYIELKNSYIRRAEIHWYEANGIGKVEFKIKKIL